MQRRLLTTAGAATCTVGVSTLLGACASQQLDDYSLEKPVLDLRSYLNGTLEAYGVFTDRSGKVVKRFTVHMQCAWQGDEGVLDEDFSYSDGSRQKRVWRLTRLGNGDFVGRADDVLGEAHGRQRGNAFHWTYTMALPVDGSVYEVKFDDWMYLVNSEVMLNKARMSKFGVHLGDVTLSFAKR